jgi:hypothetical protein
LGRAEYELICVATTLPSAVAEESGD